MAHIFYNAYIDLNDRNITNASFIKINQLRQIDSHPTAKLYVNTSIDEPTLVRNNRDKDFNKYNLTNINNITLNTQAVNDIQIFTEAYVDQCHLENERSRRENGLNFFEESIDLVINNQDRDLKDKNLTNLGSITVNRDPILNDEVSNKKFVDDEINKNTTLRFNQTL